MTFYFLEAKRSDRTSSVVSKDPVTGSVSRLIVRITTTFAPVSEGINE